MKLAESERTRKYLAKCSPAIQGQRGEATCMRVVGSFRKAFPELGEKDVLRALLDEWNSRNHPPFSDRELRRKVAQFFGTHVGGGAERSRARRRPVPASERIAEVVGAEAIGVVDLWEASPIRFEHVATEEVIDTLFPGNPLLCCGRAHWEWREGELARVAVDRTCTREEWRGSLSEREFIVPNPMIARTGTTQVGREGSHRCLSNTGPARFVVVEIDDKENALGLREKDAQACVLAYLARFAPLALVVDSRGKSLHGWFVCAGLSGAVLEDFKAIARQLGADPSVWTPCQPVRMPDGVRQQPRPDGRNGSEPVGLQSVLYFTPGVIK